MKKRASFLKALFVILAILVAGLYISGYGYLIELGAKVVELGRTSAGLEDYVYFDSRVDVPSGAYLPFLGPRTVTTAKAAAAPHK